MNIARRGFRVSAGPLASLVLAGVVAILTLTSCSWKTGDDALMASSDVVVNGKGPSLKEVTTSQSITSIPRDWSGYLGPNANGCTQQEGLNLPWDEEGPNVLWRSEVGLGYSAVVCKDDDAIAFHRIKDIECIDCLDAKTGERKWRCEYPTNYKCLHKYSDGPYSTPVIDESHVYAWGAEGVFSCVDRKTGEVVWRKQLYEMYKGKVEDFGVAASPLLENGKIIVNVGGEEPDSGIVALDAKTGETLWKATQELAAYTTPVAVTLHGKRVVFLLGYDNLIALNPENGTVHWQEPFHANNRQLGKLNATSPVVLGDCVITSAYAAGSMCVRHMPDNKASVVWKSGQRGVSNQFAHLIASKHGIFGYTTRNRSLTLFSPTNGKTLWEFEHGQGREPHIIGVGNYLLMLGEEGHLSLFSRNEEKPALLNKTEQSYLEKMCLTSPTLSGTRLFLRNEKEVVCVNLGKE